MLSTTNAMASAENVSQEKRNTLEKKVTEAEGQIVDPQRQLDAVTAERNRIKRRCEGLIKGRTTITITTETAKRLTDRLINSPERTEWLIIRRCAGFIRRQIQRRREHLATVNPRGSQLLCNSE